MPTHGHSGHCARDAVHHGPPRHSVGGCEMSLHVVTSHVALRLWALHHASVRQYATCRVCVAETGSSKHARTHHAAPLHSNSSPAQGALEPCGPLCCRSAGPKSGGRYEARHGLRAHRLLSRADDDAQCSRGLTTMHSARVERIREITAFAAAARLPRRHHAEECGSRCTREAYCITPQRIGAAAVPPSSRYSLAVVGAGGTAAVSSAMTSRCRFESVKDNFGIGLAIPRTRRRGLGPTGHRHDGPIRARPHRRLDPLRHLVLLPRREAVCALKLRKPRDPRVAPHGNWHWDCARYKARHGPHAHRFVGLRARHDAVRPVERTHKDEARAAMAMRRHDVQARRRVPHPAPEAGSYVKI